ncbi:Intradiol ring-cleavage dioxygenase [Coniella lustricola]|uniref:Intradiol ring-cleavage dioxygenase n=1 Tax=Coniella lustricola TaxID=2025994 RepID=A0A2T3A4Y1_9PEZI|nr:Intradiol ring-cleavage dioxygenase [Coniella lustricola]
MVAFSKLTTSLALQLLASGSLAHPGEEHDHAQLRRDISLRDLHAAHGARALAQCSNSATARRLKQRSVQRRADKVRALRDARGLSSTTPQKYRRDLAALEAWEEVNHNETGVYDYDMFSSIESVFDTNTSCILAPEVTAGPYYVLDEYFRSNVKESEYSEGVDLFLEVQYVDISTCAPVPDVAVDIWNANATGVYSGIYTSGNYAAEGVNSTYLRGIQLTDHEGVVSYETIFPGHYEGRATHTHLLAHTNVTLLPNGTISLFNKPVSHIGQLFYPETLRSAVEATYPYNTNTVDVTTNDGDMWSIVQADDTYDPFPQFLYLGDDITDGLFAWIQIGINASADYQTDEYYAVAGYLAADGGHAETSALTGIGGGGEGGNGTAPGGAAPSRTAIPASA